MTQVTVHEAKTRLSQLIAEVENGGEVVIARGKVPAVRLVAMKPRGKRQSGALKGLIQVDDAALAALTNEDLRDWGLS